VAQTESTRQLAVFFTDIVGSRLLYSRAGDTRAHRLVSEHEVLCEEVIRAHHGTPLKTMGDAVMATFEHPAKAVEAAFAIHARMREFNAERSLDLPLRLRVGIHCGPVLAEDRDVYGQVVNVAAHITHLAQAEEVLVSREVLEQLPDEPRGRFEFEGPEMFKGVPDVVVLYRASPAWKGPFRETTVMPHGTMAKDYQGWRLQEFPRAQVFRVRAADAGGEEKQALLRDRPIRVGRDEECEIHFPDPSLSRRHAALARVEGVPWVFDTESKTGVRIVLADRDPGTEWNVVRRAPVRPGDVVRMASLSLTVEARERDE
jgi:class 3 adenylate cyclase